MLTYIQIYKESLPFSLNMQSLVILILFFVLCLGYMFALGCSGVFFPPVRSSPTKTRLACVLYLAIDLGTTQVLFPLFLSTVMKHSKPLCIHPWCWNTQSPLAHCVCEWKCWAEFICLYPWYWNVLVQSLCIYDKSHKSKKRKSIYFIYWF